MEGTEATWDLTTDGEGRHFTQHHAGWVHGCPHTSVYSPVCAGVQAETRRPPKGVYGGIKPPRVGCGTRLVPQSFSVCRLR